VASKDHMARASSATAQVATPSIRPCSWIGNESVPIQLAQCWFPGLAMRNSFRVLFDRIASVYFIWKIYLGYILALEMASPENQHCANCIGTSAFFVTVRAGTAYRKIRRLVNNFFARIIRFTAQKLQLFWVIFCVIIFFIELWHILILWFAKMPNGGMPVFTLIATGWRYRKIFFYKKALIGTLSLPIDVKCFLTTF